MQQGATDTSLAPGSAAIRLYAGYLAEVAPDDYRLTTDEAEATHALIDTGGAEWEIAPLAEADGSVRLTARPDGTFIGY